MTPPSIHESELQQQQQQQHQHQQHHQQMMDSEGSDGKRFYKKDFRRVLYPFSGRPVASRYGLVVLLAKEIIWHSHSVCRRVSSVKEGIKIDNFATR